MDKERSHRQLDSFAPLDGAPEEHVGGGAGAEMVDYMLGQPGPAPGPHGHVSFDKLSFSDVLQFADFGPKLGLNRAALSADDVGDDDDDDSYFLRFQSLPSLPADPPRVEQEGSKTIEGGTHDGGGVSESTTLVQQQPGDGGSVGGGGRTDQKAAGEQAKSGRRKRPRSIKTSEEVESQRMTHIAVERNRRRQMNDYLRILRSLMPGSYVQRCRGGESSPVIDFSDLRLKIEAGQGDIKHELGRGATIHYRLWARKRATMGGGSDNDDVVIQRGKCARRVGNG